MKFSVTKYLTFISISGVSFICGAFIFNKGERVPVTVNMVQQAAQVFGQEFTNTEADSMLSTLDNLNNSYDKLHQLNMPNSVVPALNFNPIPVGFTMPDKQNGFKLSKVPAIKMPANKNDLAFYTIRQLAELIRTRQISSVELTRFFISRLKTYQPRLQFVVTITEDLAMKQAADADAAIRAGHYRGLLHGIPYGAKDLLAQKDYKTTFGAVPYKDQHLNIDATIITRLEKAGAVLVAKTTLGELAMGDVWFGGKTKNPWNINIGSSGSSAGSASAVSAGCLPYAIGSETLGSIVSPSNRCGDTGLRPSFGRISKYGAMALSWSMDKLGPITRSVEDAAIVFNAIQGPDGKDLSAISAPFNYNGAVKSLKGYKIGYVKSNFDRRNSENHISDSVTLAKLKTLGATLVPIEYPQYPIGSMTFLLDAEAGAAFQELVLQHRTSGMILQDKDAWPNVFRSAQFIPATEYIQANRARTLLIQDWYKTLKGLDLYIAPSFSLNLSLTNLTGNPCVVLPNGFDKNGQPLSITFMGQLFGEGKLLQAAKVYQDATSFHKKHPSLNF